MFEYCPPEVRQDLSPGIGNTDDDDNMWDEIPTDSEDDVETGSSPDSSPSAGKKRKHRYAYCNKRKRRKIRK